MTNEPSNFDFTLFELIKTGSPSCLPSQNKNIEERLTSENINQVDENGWTLLHHAVIMGEFDLVQILIEKGANSNLVNFENQSPLDLAFSNNQTNAVRALLNSGALITKENPVDQDTLIYLIKLEYGGLEHHWAKAQRLLRSDAAILERAQEKTPLETEIKKDFEWPKALYAIAKYVLDCQQSNEPTICLFNELFRQLHAPHRLIFLPQDAYVEMGISLTCKDWDGFTPLDRACMFASIPALDWLIEKGLKIPETYDVSKIKFTSSSKIESIFDFEQRFNYHQSNQIKQSLDKTLPKTPQKSIPIRL